MKKKTTFFIINLLSLYLVSFFLYFCFDFSIKDGISVRFFSVSGITVLWIAFAWMLRWTSSVRPVNRLWVIPSAIIHAWFLVIICYLYLSSASQKFQTVAYSLSIPLYFLGLAVMLGFVIAMFYSSFKKGQIKKNWIIVPVILCFLPILQFNNIFVLLMFPLFVLMVYAVISLLYCYIMVKPIGWVSVLVKSIEIFVAISAVSAASIATYWTLIILKVL